MSKSASIRVPQIAADTLAVLGYGACSSAGIGSEALWKAMNDRQPHSLEPTVEHLVPGRHPRLFSSSPFLTWSGVPRGVQRI